MSRESEKVFKAINEYLRQCADENMSTEDIDDLIEKFIEQYNNNLPNEVTEENAKTSDDFYELAENASSKAQALKFAKKAVELDSDNIDAKRMVEEITTEHPYEMVEKYQKLIVYGKKVMTKKGYMNEVSMGEYWGISETRPFIRLYSAYLDLLVDCGMMRMATNVGEEIIRYNEADNLGIRYILMHIYAYLEDENSMLDLYRKYDECDETQVLLPMSILYYKMGDFEKSKDYLKRLMKVNKDTGRFIRAFVNGELDKYASRMNPMGYQPFTIEEFMVGLHEYTYLFEGVPCYFDWAAQAIKKKQKT